jgi:hypothetical protein
MKKYLVHSPTNDELRDAAASDVLEFPVAPDFISRSRRIELHAMLRRIEENMPWRNQRPGEAERRLAEKIPVEFVL